MKLSNCEIIEARIADNNDPENLGRVRLVAPGEFETNNCPMDAIPWARPFMTSSTQTFQKPLVGDSVWHLYDTTDFSGLTNYYIPMPAMHQSTASMAAEGGDAHVLMNIENGVGNSAIKYNSTTGLGVRMNDDGLQITPEGRTLVVGGDGQQVVDICGDGVKLGDFSAEMHPIAQGDVLENVFRQIATSIDSIRMDLMINGGMAGANTIEGLTNISSVLKTTISCTNTFGN